MFFFLLLASSTKRAGKGGEISPPYVSVCFFCLTRFGFSLPSFHRSKFFFSLSIYIYIYFFFFAGYIYISSLCGRDNAFRNESSSDLDYSGPCAYLIHCKLRPISAPAHLMINQRKKKSNFPQKIRIEGFSRNAKV